jgi:phosphoserine phosphatase RsbU/P
MQGYAEIQPGDLMVLYSDGLVEATDETGEEFGDSRLAALVIRSIREEPETIRDSILSAVRDFLKHNPAQDDLTCVVAKFGTQRSMPISDQPPEETYALSRAQDLI